MTRALRIAADAAAPRSWKNGRGVARELLAGAGWRISLADIDADGPFSAYPRVRRCFAVAQGAGVVLGFAAGERQLRRDDSIAFDGADAPHCRLVDGPVQALNLFLDPGVRGTLVGSLRLGADWPLRGRYAGRVLEWNVDLAAAPATTPQLWIGIAP